jgi:hypothetical protein
MDRRSRFVFLGAGILTAAIWVSSGSTGCQSDDTSTGAGNGGPGGGAGNGTQSTGTNSTGGGSASTSTSTSSNAGGGGGFSCDTATTATIPEIAEGTTIGPDQVVNVAGVVVTSQKFLVSHSKSTGSCLWGVYISAPVVEADEYTGMLLVSYGAKASTDDGGTTAFCPLLGLEVTGDLIPDDVKPGDVLDIAGAKTSSFLLDDCATEPGGTTVPQIQLTAHSLVCSSIQKNGTAPVPTAADLTADFDALAAQTNADFHSRWAGVRVRITDVTSTIQDGDPDTAGVQPSITNRYGQMFMEGTPNQLLVNDKTYYQGYFASNGTPQQMVCHSGPEYTNPVTTFTSIEGFHTLDFCTWAISPNDKCADLVDPSEDCPSADHCAQ